MDITVYLPEKTGERLKTEMKDNDLKPSRIFRDAIDAEFRRRDAMTEALSDLEVYEFALQDDDGLEYTGRITGRLVAGDHPSTGAIYLTADKRVLVVWPEQMAYHRLDNPGEDLVQNLREYAGSPEEFAQACSALGIKPVIDL